MSSCSFATTWPRSRSTACRTETWGEHVKASVVLMPGSRLTAEALRQYCRAHMPTFRAPKEIEIVPELPKGATGKVLTAVLRARSVQAS